MKRTLEQWLAYQQQVHPRDIAMGLERVGEVFRRLAPGRPGRRVAVVGGTNGKGSTVAFLEAMARAAGLKVGAFTSPHLLRYNERIRIDGVDAADDALVAAFEAIEAARGEIPLTYFEFGTLAALLLFADAGLDLAILEVGLGGRLDAVNLIDADVAVITTVDLDHQDYLGPDRESIGAEKAGILRAGKPCVLAEKDPPSSVLRRAYAIGAFAIRGHSDYLVDDLGEDGWRWREPGYAVDLPNPAMEAPAQRGNAAAAIAALRALDLPVPDAALREGVRAARVPGRLQRLPGRPERVLDVAHNPQGARQLGEWLAAHPRPTVAVFSALADKDIAGIVAPVAPYVQGWHLGPITDAGPRGLAVDALAGRVRAALPGAALASHPRLDAALAAAAQAVGPDGRVLVFGSFHTVAEALAAR
ncbi:MAG TPA: bifunctional tetrahydrofolate synthase/dihydrofolate synthase [Arenimonas sp.]|uniref:bifunctional tetrahydrofolate synthase/dihydrofolate synthase n=1 Tax=Arenimonas sp. TaxID=1872635 RepID=UPI002D801DC7|nr:bifunctional tetrahydrofolate synthase/dihydrofolate synthase [Arenimonas sp.]HEU0152983.1 bifunctional tetrahydrofolate synthase/dihydrofolate synthase [Arenimonas sp.]